MGLGKKEMRLLKHEWGVRLIECMRGKHQDSIDRLAEQTERYVVRGTTLQGVL